MSDSPGPSDPNAAAPDGAEPWRHLDVFANGRRFHVVTAGSGPLVLLLHGFPQCWYAWRHQLRALAPRFQVVAPDLRGYGQSDKPSRVRDYRIEVLAADVVELMRAFGSPRARVVGHDWGGAVAWATAALHPAAVERLAVLNCPHPRILRRALFRDPAQLRRSWYMFAFQLPFLAEWRLTKDGAALLDRVFPGTAVRREAFTPEDLRVYREAILRPGAARAAVHYYRAAMRGSLRLPVGAVEAPTLLIWGVGDRFLGESLVHGTEEWVRAPFRLERIEGSGHWVNEEAPETVDRLLLEFL